MIQSKRCRNINRFLKIQGNIEDFGNPKYLSFFITDLSGKKYFCYSRKKIAYCLYKEDQVFLYGEKKEGKIKVLYIHNISQNSQSNFLDKYTYQNFYLSLIFLGLSIIGLLFSLYQMNYSQSVGDRIFFSIFSLELIPVAILFASIALYYTSNNLIAIKKLNKNYGLVIG